MPARKFRRYCCTGSHAALDGGKKKEEGEEEATGHAVHHEGEPVAQVVSVDTKV